MPQNDGMSRLMTKPTKWLCAQWRLRSAWASAQSDQSLRCPPQWRSTEPLATHWAHSEGSDQTGRMPILIWVFAGRTVILLVLSWGGWNDTFKCFDANPNPKDKSYTMHGLYMPTGMKCVQNTLKWNVQQLRQSMEILLLQSRHFFSPIFVKNFSNNLFQFAVLYHMAKEKNILFIYLFLTKCFLKHAC